MPFDNYYPIYNEEQNSNTSFGQFKNKNYFESSKDPISFFQTRKKIKIDNNNQNQGFLTPVKIPNVINHQSGKTIKGDENENTRISKGLRMISQIVKEIVCNEKKLTYNDVSEKLINNLKRENILQIDNFNNKNSKDEQNVKRRVYDALNVLVAAEILTRVEKEVTINHNSLLIGKSSKNGYHKIKEDSQSKIKLKEKMIQEKTKKLNDFISRVLKFEFIKQRNKLLQNPLISDQSQTEDLQAGNIFRFPFILLAQKEQTKNLPKENQLQINFRSDMKQIHVQSKDQINLYGDIDVLQKIPINQYELENFSQTLPQEFQKIYKKHKND